MPRRRNLRRFPSFRNLQIYHELAYERRTQEAVGKMYGLSQERVSQISRQVRGWVDACLFPREFVGKPGLRLHLAVAGERVRLHDNYDPLLEMFLGDDGLPRFVKRGVTVVNGEALQTLEVSELPNFRLWHQAVDVQGRLTELEAIANRGPFAHVPGEMRQTTVYRSEDGLQAPSNTHGTLSQRSNAATNRLETGSSGHENRGGGVLTALLPVRPETAQPTPELTVAAAMREAVVSEHCGT